MSGVDPELEKAITDFTASANSTAEAFHHWVKILKYPVAASWIFDIGYETWRLFNHEALDISALSYTAIATLGALAFKGGEVYFSKQSADAVTDLFERGQQG